MKVLYYEWLETVVDSMWSDYNISYDDCTQAASDGSAATLDESQWWMDKYISMVCEQHSIDHTYDNFRQKVINAKDSLNETKEDTIKLLISVITPQWNSTEDLTIYRNGQLYRQYEEHIVDLTQKPSGVQTVHFVQCHITERSGQKKVVVTINRWSWEFDFSDMPDTYKRCYVTQLKFQNQSIPPDLSGYNNATFDTADLIFDVNLDNGVEILS